MLSKKDRDTTELYGEVQCKVCSHVNASRNSLLQMEMSWRRSTSCHAEFVKTLVTSVKPKVR